MLAKAGLENDLIYSQFSELRNTIICKYNNVTCPAIIYFVLSMQIKTLFIKISPLNY